MVTNKVAPEGNDVFFKPSMSLKRLLGGGTKEKADARTTDFVWRRPGQMTTGVFKTHYQLTGRSDGKLVICIHGIGTCSAFFDDLAAELEMSGFYVLRYDLMGMGFSHPAPSSNYGQAAQMMQLEELLYELGLMHRPFNIIGHSTGACLAVKFAYRYPRAQSLVLLAPTGLCDKRKTGLFACMSAANRSDDSTIGLEEKDWRKGFITHEGQEGEREAQFVSRQRLMYENNPVAKEAVILGHKYFPAHGLEAELARVANRNKRKILVGWGKEDVSVPFPKNFKRWQAILDKSFAAVEYEIVEKGGHLFPLEKRNQTCARVVTFLATPSATSSVQVTPRNEG